MRKQTLVLVFTACCVLALCSSASAQGEESKSEQEDLAKTIQNPLASLVNLPMQANYNLGVGDYDRTSFNLNIQPVIPYHPNEDWNLITRTIIPLNSVPMGETDSIFGIGDTSLSLFLSPAKASSLTWGIGPAFTLPTASNPEALGRNCPSARLEYSSSGSANGLWVP